MIIISLAGSRGCLSTSATKNPENMGKQMKATPNKPTQNCQHGQNKTTTRQNRALNVFYVKPISMELIKKYWYAIREVYRKLHTWVPKFLDFNNNSNFYDQNCDSDGNIKWILQIAKWMPFYYILCSTLLELNIVFRGILRLKRCLILVKCFARVFNKGISVTRISLHLCQMTHMCVNKRDI